MERRIEIYSPGYLFEGTRPEIVDAPLFINYGSGQFEIGIGNDPVKVIDSVVLISLPSVTHCFDCNQRYLILEFTQDGRILLVNNPENEYIAPPGYYMLFILLDKSYSNSGDVRIPSIAKIIKLES